MIIRKFWQNFKCNKKFNIYAFIQIYDFSEFFADLAPKITQKSENLALIGWLGAGNNLKVSVTYWWKIWTFDQFQPKPYLSL